MEQFNKMKQSFRDLFGKLSGFNNSQLEYLENLDRLSAGEKSDIAIGKISPDVYLTEEELTQNSKIYKTKLKNAA